MAEKQINHKDALNYIIEQQLVGRLPDDVVNKLCTMYLKAEGILKEKK